MRRTQVRGYLRVSAVILAVLALPQCIYAQQSAVKEGANDAGGSAESPANTDSMLQELEAMKLRALKEKDANARCDLRTVRENC